MNIILSATEAAELGLKGTTIENVPMDKGKNGAIVNIGYMGTVSATDKGESVRLGAWVKKATVASSTRKAL